MPADIRHKKTFNTAFLTKPFKKLDHSPKPQTIQEVRLLAMDRLLFLFLLFIFYCNLFKFFQNNAFLLCKQIFPFFNLTCITFLRKEESCMYYSLI